MRLSKAIKSTWQNHPILSYAFLFVVAFSLSLYLQHFYTFLCPDSFYHIKMALLMRDQGLVHEFPWLQFTVFKDAFVDHHLLYHALLIPFVTLLPPVAGAKLLASILAGLVPVFVYGLLRSRKARYAFLFALLTAVMGAFLFRMNLVRVPSLSVLMLLAGTWAIFGKRYVALGVISFLYVWFYNGWPLIFVVIAAYMAASALHAFAKARKRKSSRFSYESIKPFWRRQIIRLNWRRMIKNALSTENLRLLASAGVGAGLGLLINPYFPDNVIFSWIHIVKIGLVNYQGILNVGGEWYPYDLLDLAADTSLLFVFAPIAGALFVLRWRKQSVESWTALLLFLFFLAFTMKSRRNLDYFVPFLALFAGFAVSEGLHRLKIWSFAKKHLARKWRMAIIAYFVVLAGLVFINDYHGTVLSYKNGFAVNRFQGAAEWLQRNTEPDSVVFHTSWDEFPMLFYYNHHNRYIVGLDPTFMYDPYPDLHRQWEKVTRGEVTQGLGPIISQNFGASYVFATTRHEALNALLQDDPDFVKRYEDHEAMIYELP